MKVLRFIYYLLMPVFLFAGLYTGMRVFFIVLIAQILLVLAIFGLNQWTIHTFSYTQTLDALEAVKGSETALHLSILNEKPFPLSMMQIDVELAAPSENRQISFSLLPFAGKDFDFRVSVPYRGVYPIGITTMRITDVFGLLPMRFDMRKLPYYRQPRLTVYPRAEDLASLYADVADEKLFGERFQHNAESGSSITGARAYRPGDPLKQIHWKKSAAHGELFVKQYEQPIHENLTLLIDNCTHGASGEDALARADTVCEAAACITLHCLSQNRSAVLRAMCDTRSVDSEEEALSVSDFEKIRHWLAQLPFGEDPAKGPLPAGSADGRNALILVTDCFTPELESALTGAASDFSAVTLVLVGDESRNTGLIHTIRLPLGCDVAAELVSLE